MSLFFLFSGFPPTKDERMKSTRWYNHDGIINPSFFFCTGQSWRDQYGLFLK